MSLFGETQGLYGTHCFDCENPLELQVLRSFAGYYLGYFCPNCGPYSRESGYYSTKEEAEEELSKIASREKINNLRQ